MEHDSACGCRFVLLHISKNTPKTNSPVRRLTHGGIFFGHYPILLQKFLLSTNHEELWESSILFFLEDDLSIKCKLFIRSVLAKTYHVSSETYILEVKCYAFVCDSFNCCSSLCFSSAINTTKNFPYRLPLILLETYGFPSLKFFRYAKRPFDHPLTYRKVVLNTESK